MFLQTMILHTLVHIGDSQDMILLKLVPLGNSPTITFTTAAPVQPGPLYPDDDPAYAGPSR